MSPGFGRTSHTYASNLFFSAHNTTDETFSPCKLDSMAMTDQCIHTTHSVLALLLIISTEPTWRSIGYKLDNMRRSTKR